MAEFDWFVLIMLGTCAGPCCAVIVCMRPGHVVVSVCSECELVICYIELSIMECYTDSMMNYHAHSMM